MAVSVNGVNLPDEWRHSIKINSTDVQEVYVNGTLVWKYSEPCYSDCGSDCTYDDGDCYSDCGTDCYCADGCDGCSSNCDSEVYCGCDN